MARKGGGKEVGGKGVVGQGLMGNLGWVILAGNDVECKWVAAQ
jgi:hypothetical protein